MILCQFCGAVPEVVPIKVFYSTARRNGLHDMFRAACKCGAIGKCRPDEQSAIAAWDEPWQALVAPSPSNTHHAGIATAIQWLRNLDVEEKPATQGHSAVWLADQMERALIDSNKEPKA